MSLSSRIVAFPGARPSQGQLCCSSHATAPACPATQPAWCLGSVHVRCPSQPTAQRGTRPRERLLQEWGSHAEQGSCLPAQAPRNRGLQQLWEGGPLKRSGRWKGLRDPKGSLSPPPAMDRQAESGHCLLLPLQLGLGWLSPHYWEAGSAIPVPTGSTGRPAGCCGCACRAVHPCPGSIPPQRCELLRGRSQWGWLSVLLHPGCCVAWASGQGRAGSAVCGPPAQQGREYLSAPSLSQSTEYHEAPSCQAPICDTMSSTRNHRPGVLALGSAVHRASKPALNLPDHRE